MASPFGVTVTELKSFLGVPAADTSRDTTYTLDLKMAQKHVEMYIGHAIETQTYTDEWHQGLGIDRIYTKARPITTITAVSIDGNSLDVSTLYNRDRYIDLDGYVVPLNIDVLVTYVAGYAEAAVPDDIKMAILQIAAYLEGQQKSTGTVGLTSRSDGEVSRTINTDYLSAVLETLEDYRREIM